VVAIFGNMWSLVFKECCYNICVLAYQENVDIFVPLMNYVTLCLCMLILIFRDEHNLLL